MACGDRKTCAKIAILDPDLTLTQPRAVTSLTGIDALSHAVETYMSKRRNLISMMYSREAFRLLTGAIETVLSRPEDRAARAEMQMGACFAGLAIESSMLGAAHALANPLTAKFGTAHGQAVGLMLPHVVRYNAELYEADYRALMTCFAAPTVPASDGQPLGSRHLADWLGQVLEAAGLATDLRALGVELENVPGLAAAAVPQWTGTFNPRPLDAQILADLYRAAF
jgi:alcohol dehydrogenase